MKCRQTTLASDFKLLPQRRGGGCSINTRRTGCWVVDNHMAPTWVAEQGQRVPAPGGLKLLITGAQKINNYQRITFPLPPSLNAEGGEHHLRGAKSVPFYQAKPTAPAILAIALRTPSPSPRPPTTGPALNRWSGRTTNPTRHRAPATCRCTLRSRQASWDLQSPLSSSPVSTWKR